jgi:hypothetical protein
MFDLSQPGWEVIVVNAGLAAGLVIYGRRRPTRRPSRYLELILGVVCFALAALNVAIAAGPGRRLPILANLTAIPARDFYLSAFCYSICGGALLLGRRQSRSDRNVSSRSGPVKL